MSAKSPEKEKNPAPSEGKTVEEKAAEEKVKEAEEKPTEEKAKEAEEKPTEEKVRLVLRHSFINFAIKLLSS